jgi:hypothetical protein
MGGFSLGNRRLRRQSKESSASNSVYHIRDNLGLSAPWGDISMAEISRYEMGVVSLASTNHESF